MYTQSKITKDAEIAYLPSPSVVVTRHILSSAAKQNMQAAKSYYFFFQEKLMKLNKVTVDGN